MIKDCARKIIKKPAQFFSRLFSHELDPFERKIEEKTILMLGLGKHVRGNLLYLLNELNSDDEYKDFRIYVRTSDDTDADVNRLIKLHGWQRVRTVPDDDRYVSLLETSEFLLTETYFPERWVKRTGQISINIWHGTPLKKIGPAKNTKNCHRNGASQKNFINADYLLYPNQYTKNIMLSSYRVTPLMRGKALLMGYPRTGGMLSTTSDEALDIREILSAHGEKKIYAYMPTYRGTLMTETEEEAQTKDFLDYMENHLSNDQILYVNLHHKMDLAVDYSGYRKIFPFPSDIDSYRLLAASDALITDYSSVMFDYLSLRRQIVLYIPDYDLYNGKRGLFMDITSLPFDQAFTPEEALRALNRGKQYDDDTVYENFCTHDSPDNAKKLCRLFLHDESGLSLEELPKSSLKSLLIHTEWAPRTPATELLSSYAKLSESSDYEIYFSCNEKLQTKASGAYPMFRRFPVIGSSDDPYLTPEGRETKKRYLGGTLSFAKAMKTLREEYARMPKRMYGDSEFSGVLIYDCKNPERILGLSCSEAPCLLFLHDDLLDQIDAGDIFLKDAVCYAVAEEKADVLVEDETGKERAILLLYGLEAREPVICSDGSQLEQAVRRKLGI